LAGQDAPAVFEATNRFVAWPQETVAFLKVRLRPSPDHSERIARLLTDLDSKRFAIRKKASETLETLGSSVKPALHKALADRPSLEVRRRIERLLERLEGLVASPEELRSLRAIEVLELIGTDGAQKVLRDLATGAAGARQTQEAKASLQRLRKG